MDNKMILNSSNGLDIDKLTDDKNIADAIGKFFDKPSKDTEKIFINKIKNSNYLVPIKFEGRVKDGIIDKNSKLSFVFIKDVNGKKFSPVFTCYDELKKWNKDHEQMIVMPYQQAVDTLLEPKVELDGITINPFNQNIVLTDEKINYIKNYDFQ